MKGFAHQLFTLLKEFGNAAHKISVFIHPEPVGFLAALHFHIRAQFIDYFPGGGKSVNHNRLHRLPFKGPESAVRHTFRCVANQQINPKVGLVRAVFFHGVVIGNSGKGRFGSLLILAVFCKNGRQHIFDYAKHVILGRKSHFHIQLVKLAGRTVRPCVLIPETGRNLKISVKARRHKELFKLLRRLRQRIKFPRMVS